MSTNPPNDEPFNIHASADECGSPCIVACRYACKQVNIQESNKFNMQAQQQLKCWNSFSISQINIISIIRNSDFPLSYQDISDILNSGFQTTMSADAVRGSISRLRSNGFILATYKAIGKRRGNIYTVLPLVCVDIPLYDIRPRRYQPIRTTMHPAPSSFKDRLDSNLSIFNPAVNPSTNPNKQHHKQRLESLSEDDIKFHFENLAKNGFGTSQIQQIITRLEQVGTNLENVMQGLTHAEWDLAHGQMKDKHGELIKSPTSWVFQILAKQGYYPRPKNYISLAEQIEFDAKIETEALKKAKKDFEDEQYENWLNSLSEEKKQELMEEKKRTRFHNLSAPDDAILHSCYMDYLKSFAP